MTIFKSNNKTSEKMNQNEKKPLAIGHLICEATPKIKETFLRESKMTYYSARKYGVTTSPQIMSDAFRKFLCRHGFSIIENREYDGQAGIAKYKGVKITVDKIKENQEIKQILITVTGKDDNEVKKNIEAIQKDVKPMCKTLPEISMYTKTIRC